jgi:hypothetical protein
MNFYNKSAPSFSLRYSYTDAKIPEYACKINAKDSVEAVV